MEGQEDFVGKKLGVDIYEETIIKAYNCLYCRVIPPDCLFTMDEDENRVNIFVDDSYIIQRITIG